MDMGKVERMAKLTLVGRFMSKPVQEPSLKLWLIELWYQVLGYIPRYHLLMRWICFVLNKEDNVEKITHREWMRGPSRLSQAVVSIL